MAQRGRLGTHSPLSSLVKNQRLTQQQADQVQALAREESVPVQVLLERNFGLSRREILETWAKFFRVKPYIPQPQPPDPSSIPGRDRLDHCLLRTQRWCPFGLREDGAMEVAIVDPGQLPVCDYVRSFWQDRRVAFFAAMPDDVEKLTDLVIGPMESLSDAMAAVNREFGGEDAKPLDPEQVMSALNAGGDAAGRLLPALLLEEWRSGVEWAPPGRRPAQLFTLVQAGEEDALSAATRRIMKDWLERGSEELCLFSCDRTEYACVWDGNSWHLVAILPGALSRGLVGNFKTLGSLDPGVSDAPQSGRIDLSPPKGMTGCPSSVRIASLPREDGEEAILLRRP